MNYIYLSKDREDHIILKTENPFMNTLQQSHLNINARRHTHTHPKPERLMIK